MTLDTKIVEVSKDKPRPLYCSFCGKDQQEAEKLVAGPTSYICNECIDLCSEIIHRPRDMDAARKSLKDLGDEMSRVEKRMLELEYGRKAREEARAADMKAEMKDIMARLEALEGKAPGQTQ